MDFGAASGYGFGRGGALGAGAGPATQAAPSAAASPSTAQQPGGPASATPPGPATPTSFSIKLESFPAADKIKVIKEVRAITGLGLKESKELVESVPKFIKRDLSKAECDTLVVKLKEAGAKVTVE